MKIRDRAQNVFVGNLDADDNIFVEKWFSVMQDARDYVRGLGKDHAPKCFIGELKFYATQILPPEPPVEWRIDEV